MRNSVRYPLIRWGFLAGLSLCAATAAAAGVPREHHPWGRFKPGAWKAVRVVTESFDSAGQATSISITDTRTTLAAADAETFTLRIESTVEVAGKRITAAPQTVVQRYDGGPTEQKSPVQSLGTERLMIDSAPYNCEVQQIEVTAASGRSTTKTHYSDRVFPYVLRRETTTTNSQNVVSGRSTLEVVALEMPAKVLHETQSAAHLKAVQQHEKGSTVTLAVTTPEVPGGVVSHTSKELDPDNRIVRRSTLELTDFAPTAAIEVEQPLPRRPRMMRRHRGREGALPQQPVQRPGNEYSNPAQPG